MNPHDTVLVLRTSNSDGTSRGGFRWPQSGPVEAPDWNPQSECGGGLHGALWGEGDGELFRWNPNALWQVVEVAAADIIDLGGKVKFPRGTLIHTGDRLSATAFLAERATGRAIIGGTATAGFSGTATAGDRGTATAGNGGTATAGKFGTATVGNGGTATAGKFGTATAGDRGTATAGGCGAATAGQFGAATAGDYGTATAGNWGTATAGDYGTAIAGYYGTATAGTCGTATAGTCGTATAGTCGTATAGTCGQVRVAWDDGTRLRLAVGYVGEDGILPDTPYRVVDGKLTPAGAR